MTVGRSMPNLILIQCISVSLITSLFTGTCLEKLRQDIYTTIQHISDFNTGIPIKDILVLQRCVEMLYCEYTSDITEHPLVSEYEATAKNEAFSIAMLHVMQGYIYYARGDYKKCSALAQQTGILLDKLLSYFANMPVLYHQGISLYVDAQNTSSIIKRAKLKGLAVKRHKILRSWAKDGCCNVVHYVAILDAELAILKREKKERVEELYQKAIVWAARGGFVQDAAIANERLASFFRDSGEKVEAGRRYEQSIQFFEDWGYKKRAQRLAEESGDLISSWSLKKRDGS